MTDKEKLKAQFKVGDTIRNKHWDTAVHKITSMDDKSYHLDNGGKVDISSQQLWELVEEPVNEEWIEELRTKLDSMSKEEFEQVWGKYKVEEIEEPVSDELEKAAGNYAFTMSGEDEVSKYYAFLAGAKWQKQKTIDKACEYLDLHCDEVKTEDNGIAGWIDNEFINNFKQAMEDE